MNNNHLDWSDERTATTFDAKGPADRRARDHSEAPSSRIGRRCGGVPPGAHARRKFWEPARVGVEAVQRCKSFSGRCFRPWKAALLAFVLWRVTDVLRKCTRLEHNLGATGRQSTLDMCRHAPYVLYDRFTHSAKLKTQFNVHDNTANRLQTDKDVVIVMSLFEGGPADDAARLVSCLQHYLYPTSSKSKSPLNPVEEIEWMGVHQSSPALVNKLSEW